MGRAHRGRRRRPNARSATGDGDGVSGRATGQGLAAGGSPRVAGGRARGVRMVCAYLSGRQWRAVGKARCAGLRVAALAHVVPCRQWIASLRSRWTGLAARGPVKRLHDRVEFGGAAGLRQLGAGRIPTGRSTSGTGAEAFRFGNCGIGNRVSGITIPALAGFGCASLRSPCTCR